MSHSSRIINARRPGASVNELVNVHIQDGMISKIVDAAADADAVADEVIDAAGRWLMPGLWDEHVHMTQWAQLSRRVDLSSAASASEAAGLMGDAATAVGTEQGTAATTDTLVGAGFRDALWPDSPDLSVFDQATGDTPTVMVSADLHCAWANSAAMRRYGIENHPTGFLREEASFALVRELENIAPETLDEWVSDAAAAAAARGVVGIVDLEIRWNKDDWQRRLAGGFNHLNVEFGVYTQHLERAISEGMRTGNTIDSSDLVRVGPYKVLVDGSLNTRTAWCFDSYSGSSSPESEFGLGVVTGSELVGLLERASGAGFMPAVHAIGDRAGAEALDAFETVGCGGRIEHAQLLRDADLARFAELGITASVQPEHAMDDRDVADRYWEGRTERAFPLASLVEAGATLALGSDAPVATLDPWITISAAVGRTRGGQPAWHPEQALPIATALRASARGRSEVRAGDRADLILVERDALREDAESLRTMPVALTMLGGRITHRAL